MIDEKEFQKDDAYEVVKNCSIPRLTGTEGEIKTLNWIEQNFKSIGLTFQKESFSANSFWVQVFLRVGMTFGVVSSLIMILFSNLSPIWNLFLIIITIIITLNWLNKMNGGDLKIIGKTVITHNLLGKIPAKNTNSKRIILFMGHHDSKSQRLTTVQRSTFFTFGIASLLLVIITFSIDTIYRFITSKNSLLSLKIFGFLAFGILILCAIPLSINIIENKSPGALDNASSIAALYLLAKYFIKNPLQNYELWFLLTGAEEWGMIGARNFVNVHRFELSPDSTIVINFDMIGRKDSQIEVMDTVGFPKAKPVSPKLNSFAREIAEAHGFPFNGFYLPTGASTDRFIFSLEGIDSMDFINKRAAFETHSKDDTITKFDSKLCCQFVIVAAEVAKKIDQDIK